MKENNKLIILPNEDKLFHEEPDYDNLCNFSHSFRCCELDIPNGTLAIETLFSLIFLVVT